MQRRPEPELMLDMDQSLAYAAADFEEPHSRVVSLFTEKFPGLELAGPVLDIGCGPGDVSCRFVRRFAAVELVGVDGSAAMLSLAEKSRLLLAANIGERITYVNCTLPSPSVPERPYRAIISSSFLHHLHRPEVLWQAVSRLARPGCLIFVVDLRRPASEDEARRLTDHYAAFEPEILRRDFFHSLLAAFTVEEVQHQLQEAGLHTLQVEPSSDRHLVIWGGR